LKEKILIIDDDASVRKVLSSILSENGYFVASAENSKQALRAAGNEHFDLALIDVVLPGIKGTELLRKLKEKQPRMVKIIVTGFPSLENAIKAVNEGADGYVLKPWNVKELLNTYASERKLKRATDSRSSSKSQKAAFSSARFAPLNAITQNNIFYWCKCTI
jgi:DNA-binding NtrC family response regulator